MTVTVDLDEELVRTAEQYTEISDRSELVREALEWLIAREGARAIGRLGGTQPDVEVPGRSIPSR